MGRFSNLRVTLAQGPCQPSLYRSSMGYVLPKRALPSDVCSQKLWGLSFLALEPSAPGPGVGLGLLTPEISLPNFYPPHVGEGPASCFFFTFNIFESIAALLSPSALSIERVLY